MPKISKESLEAQDFGALGVHEGEVADYTVNFLSVRETQDLTPMLAGLPDGRCQCPHWGYVVKGRQTWRFADREETAPGSEETRKRITVLAAEMKATSEAITRYMEASS